ncbi:MAG: metal ABC transporter ATP-binding protein [Candidatus Bipolaricaulia bacterium]
MDDVNRKHRPVRHDPDAPVLEFESVSARYGDRVAIDNLSFRLETGDQVAVVGPNGAGKSTLLKLVAGISQPTSGRIQIYGHRPSKHVCVAYVPQRTDIDWRFPVTVFDVVIMGRVGQLGLFKWPRQPDRELVQRSLATVGADQLADRQIGELSDGQQQRVFIARALAQQAELMLLDEPLTGLDAHAQEEVWSILNVLREQNVTSLVTIHNLDLAAERFDRVMLLNQALFGFGPPEETLSDSRVAAAYGGRATFHESAVPRDD